MDRDTGSVKQGTLGWLLYSQLLSWTVVGENDSSVSSRLDVLMIWLPLRFEVGESDPSFLGELYLMRCGRLRVAGGENVSNLSLSFVIKCVFSSITWY